MRSGVCQLGKDLLDLGSNGIHGLLDRYDGLVLLTQLLSRLSLSQDLCILLLDFLVQKIDCSGDWLISSRA